jgi:hypothetical protein
MEYAMRELKPAMLQAPFTVYALGDVVWYSANQLISELLWHRELPQTWQTESCFRLGLGTNFGAVERIHDERFSGECHTTDYVASGGSIETPGTTGDHGTVFC